VQLPQGSHVLELPADFTQNAKCLTLGRHSKASGSKVDITLQLTRTCAEVSTSEYPAFREKLLKAVSEFSEQLAFSGAASVKTKALK
jgi:hypothetical protein